VLVVAAVAVFVLVTSLRGIAGFYTDYLWFDSVDQTQVWRTVLGSKLALALLFTGAFFALLWVNLLVADRNAPAFRTAGPEEDLVERYQQVIGGRTGLVRAGVSLVFAVIAGAGVSSQWNSWVLFLNGGDFARQDPQFGRDIGFYVFRLPFLSFVTSWLFAAVVIVLIVTAVAHYLNGGIRLQAPGPERVTAAVRVHMSVLLGLLALVRAAGYYLQQYELTVSTRGTVDGATYTDVNVQLPAIQLLMLISVGSFLLFIVNIRRKGWVLPVLGVGLWALVALLAGTIVPALVQRFQVEPSESTREREFIQRNIEATQFAIGLDTVGVEEFEPDFSIGDEGLDDNADVIDNIRLWDPESNVLGATYQTLQALRGFYEVGDIDIDRYEIDGETTQVAIATRELDSSNVPQQSWEGTTLAYTHGYGVIAAPTNERNSDGAPNFAVSGVPLRDGADLDIEEPGLYFGEGQDGYVIVDSRRQEIDYEDESGTPVPTDYTGEDGVNMGSFVRRAAFALRFGDVNPLVSGNVTSESRILYFRDVRERLDNVAPFLAFDADPYPAVVDGRITWIVDGYTTTDRFPYSQRAITDGLEGTASGLDRRFNYARNSVKATIDAYDGTISLHVVDDEDPIIAAYEQAFPDLFADEAPTEDLQAHFRYPEDLFRVQTNMWGRYHIEDPGAFYTSSGGWIVARDPGTAAASSAQAATPTSPTTVDQEAPPRQQNRYEPIYQLTRLPGRTEQEFVMLRPYSPVPTPGGEERQQLTAFLVADSDPANYGRLTSYEVRGDLPDGPGLVFNSIQSDVNVAEERRLLCQGEGATCTFANIVIVPIEDSLLFVQPLYVRGGANSPALLRRIIVEYDGEVSIGDSLRNALAGLPQFEDVPETSDDIPINDDLDPDVDTDQTDPEENEPPPGDAEPATPDDVAALLVEAQGFFDAADAALAEGDFASYGENITLARERVDQVEQLLAATTEDPPPDGTTTTTTDPEATTTTTTGEA
jgi:uncharacterized membrane protein (UPF0182 family)